MLVDGEAHLSDPIVLSEQDDKARFLPKMEGVVYCRSSMVVTIPIRDKHEEVVQVEYNQIYLETFYPIYYYLVEELILIHILCNFKEKKKKIILVILKRKL